MRIRFSGAAGEQLDRLRPEVRRRLVQHLEEQLGQHRRTASPSRRRSRTSTLVGPVEGIERVELRTSRRGIFVVSIHPAAGGA